MNGTCFIGAMFTFREIKDSVATIIIYDDVNDLLFYKDRAGEANWISVEDFMQSNREEEISLLATFWFNDDLRIGQLPGVLQITSSAFKFNAVC